MADPKAVTIQRGSNILNTYSCPIPECQRIQAGTKKEEQRRPKINEVKGGEEGDPRVQKDLRGRLSEARSSKSQQ